MRIVAFGFEGRARDHSRGLEALSLRRARLPLP